ncbi:MAG: DNA translocase FtsK [bacterium]|nr:DNA translocase FtsK [bacterium]
MTARRTREQRDRESRRPESPFVNLHPDIRKVIWIVVFFGAGLLAILAAAGQAGPAGGWFYGIMETLFGWGYVLIPLTCFLIAASFFAPERTRLVGVTLIGACIFVLSGLGFIDIIFPGSGGWIGTVVGKLQVPFGVPASVIIMVALLTISFLTMVNRPFKLSLLSRLFGRARDVADNKLVPIQETASAPDALMASTDGESDRRASRHTKELEAAPGPELDAPRAAKQKPIRNYIAPPLSLLVSSVEKPTAGDLQANANIIKRTLDSFGIPVEMGEISVGPTITRYTLKPAEGVKISRITALSPDLALSLAAHPIRIEAPIPGKSLVGIEVPNKAAAMVRLGSLLLYPEFQKADPLTFALGRNVQGEPIFLNIEKMPHLMVAGATGSGKSITIHSILLSLLYKNSPEMLNLILIDPKRVELSIYDGLPHLIAPVVTDNKHAIGALRWVIQEMDRRYETLLTAGARDVGSYNKSAGEKLSYIVIVIDELADLMQTYGREVEGSIIRLAQMARATGIHLIVSTQRPSVEVVTGLIKANITTRIALQVASQIDSRTILDTGGAEKLLGRGDLLLVSAELSKPRRIQGAFVPEEEIKAVTSFIRDNNEPRESSIMIEAVNGGNEATGLGIGDSKGLFEGFAEDGDDDALYVQAVELVKVAQKASASLLQRRLKVGYARAARLLDMMEERGVIGPGEGAKPREVYEVGGEE